MRPNYIFNYIIEGKGRFSVGKETYNLCAGQGFLIEPEVVTYMRQTAKNRGPTCGSGLAEKKRERI